MSIHIGLDIGAVSVKLAALGEPADERLFHSAAQCCDTFYQPQASGRRPLLLSRYRRFQGSPREAATGLLEKMRNYVPRGEIAGIRMTGSGGRLISGGFDSAFENEFRAIAKGVRALHPDVRTIFEIGGESSKYLRLEAAPAPKHLGIADYESSGDCAAGTGSFIDQQASRLLFTIEDVGPASCAAACAARIAGRCSVFAKTDMIHAQQTGHTADQILRGLCEAVARNFKASIVKGRAVVPPVAFIGGVALNQCVAAALRQALHLRDGDLFVPEVHAWMGAVGAAMLGAEEQDPTYGHRAQAPAPAAVAEGGAPLSMSEVTLLADRVRPAGPLPPGHKTPVFLGIDIGSVSTNLVVLDTWGNLLKEVYLYTEGRPIEAVTRGLKEIEAELGDRLDIAGVGTTGSGRELIGELVGADTVKDEITAHKTGALHICEQLGLEPVDTIFEIGGQDSKFIRIDQGVVVDFTMNEACAAGTGSFLEEQAEKLGISIKKEFARLALASPAPARLGERCTVFMERDLTALLLQGAKVGDLAAGLAYSVALNYLHRVVRGRKLGAMIFFQGGTAYNAAVAAAFAGLVKKKIIVPPHAGVMGAIGMALLARERMQGSGRRSRFRGYHLDRVPISSREFVCRACPNYCEMREFSIEGQKSYWGDRCSDRFRKRSRSDRQPVIEDLIDFRTRLMEAVAAPAKGDRPVVGIPRAMPYYDRFPFWCRYFQELGFDVMVSSPTDRKVCAAGEELAVAHPCFPVLVAHGHVIDLVERKAEYILLPNVVNAEAPRGSVNSHLCPWSQTLPFVVRQAPQLNGWPGSFLIPTVHFRSDRPCVERELAEFARGLGVSGSVNHRAVLAAYESQRAFQDALLAMGEAALGKLRAAGDPALVLVGRPYNLYDPGVNCDIPRKLRSLYGVNVVPMDFLPLDHEDVSEIHPNMYWSAGRRILAAARVAGRHPNMHLVYISNFKCGPDSYIKSFLNDAAGKPSLMLQFDGHSNDAGFITRCEAYLDSKGFLLPALPG